MRCKQGDLAVVCGAEATPEMLNRFVIVVRLARPGEIFGWIGLKEWEPAVWVVRPASDGTLPWRLSNGWLAEVSERPFADDCLRPIRDPGDDAVDETLLRLPSPSRETSDA